MTGALHGIRVIELGGVGPGPHACMMLADLGADVVRIEPPSAPMPPSQGVQRGRRVVTADLKDRRQRDGILDLIASADVVVEGFRPGVAERLGLGPDDCAQRNEGLVYGRMTGWGQDGPLAARAGHDLTYIAVTGALSVIRAPDGKPVPPANIVGDFGGGSLFLVTGILAALLERVSSGRGQVVDAAIVDGVSVLSQMLWDFRSRPLAGIDGVQRPLSGELPFYDTYRCADGGYVAVAPIEPQFYAEFLAGLGLDRNDLPAQWDPAGWPVLRKRFAATLATRSRDVWVARFDGTDACVAPVLSWDEALEHPHMRRRGVFREEAGAIEVRPAPRFSRSSSQPQTAGVRPASVSHVAAQWQRTVGAAAG
ncbi:CaiB/BaiF CoA transferase family protein [Microbacterium sp. RD1]|uniref:CaiB/BaiF CoA transferase family protein n=1 Tax=Microbacterium sp. RD1 TaxID=3457313 RepID=UPI003FA52854